MKEPILTPADYIVASAYAEVPRDIHSLEAKKHLFNRLTVSNATKGHIGTEIDKGLDCLSDMIVKFGKILANPLEYASEYTEVLETVQDSFDLADKLTPDPFPEDESPRPIFDPELLMSNYKKIFSLHMILQMSGAESKQEIYPYNVINKGFRILRTRYMNVLNALTNVFGITSIEVPDSDDEIKFTLHDKQMFFTEAEIAEAKKLEEERELAEAKAKELEKLRSQVKDNANIILKAYNTHKQMGNLKKFEFTEEALCTLKEQNSPEECEKVSALYSLLMAMGDTVRYMPGESGDPFECIMGSFMELENDILSYNQMFQVYLGNYGLTHSRVARSLPMFSTSNGRIVAQYVDTKEYIDEPNPSMDNERRTIHLFSS